MKIIASLAYFMIFGKPLIMYMGLITLLSFSITAIIGYLNFKGIKTLPFRWHPRLALISLTLAFFHGILGISLYFL